MELKPLLKEWRIWLLIISLGISLVLLGPSYVEDPETGEIKLDTNIQRGLDLEGGTRVFLNVDTEEPTTEEQAQTVSQVLESRISAFGLAQADVRTVRLADEFGIQIEMASTNQTQIRELLEQEGTFEARMPIRVGDEPTEFTIDETYTFTRENGAVRMEGPETDELLEQTGDRIEDIDGTDFVYINSTEQEARLEVLAYSGEDVQEVLTSDARVEGESPAQFRFPVVISSEAAENVQKVASNYDTVVQQGQPYLGWSDTNEPAQLGLYVDGEEMSRLNMASVFASQTVTQPSISGSRETRAEARQEMQNLQSILQSGRLPFSVDIQTISTVSSTLGAQFMQAAIISIMSALLAVGALVYIRYRDLTTSVPIILTGASEVFILLGAWFSTVATLDLASIAGIIAAVGTGVDDQIVIKDEAEKERITDWTEKLKRAFFVIFTAAGSTIGAMAPLVSPSVSNLAIGAAGISLILYTLYTRGTNPHYVAIGTISVVIAFLAYQMNPSAFALQSVRGFAVTTIIGILIGISITRPAYAVVLEHVDQK